MANEGYAVGFKKSAAKVTECNTIEQVKFLKRQVGVKKPGFYQHFCFFTKIFLSGFWEVCESRWGKETGFLAASLFFNKDLSKKPGFSVGEMG